MLGSSTGTWPERSQSVDWEWVAHHQEGGVAAGIADGLKSARASGGQHFPARKQGGGESCESGGGEKKSDGGEPGPGLGGVLLQVEPSVRPCTT